MTPPIRPAPSKGPHARRHRSTRDHALHLLREMLRIRRFEEKAAELYSLSRSAASSTSTSARRRSAVGAMQALTPDDAVVATYREHGQALARGLPAASLMAEMFGKATGCSRGRGGSMHFFDVSRRFYGGNAIVAGGLPIAVGLALADKLQGSGQRVTACFFGDGAVAEGEFHESLNLAALWRLPVLFLCENNHYAMGTSIAEELAQPDIHLRAESYGIPAEAVDGMDVLAVEAATRRAGEAVRDRRGPALPRAAHLPVPRPLDGRPRPVPRQGGGRAVEGARPDRAVRGAPARGEDPRRRRAGRDGVGDRR